MPEEVNKKVQSGEVANRQANEDREKAERAAINEKDAPHVKNPFRSDNPFQSKPKEKVEEKEEEVTIESLNKKTEEERGSKLVPEDYREIDENSSEAEIDFLGSPSNKKTTLTKGQLAELEDHNVNLYDVIEQGSEGIESRLLAEQGVGEAIQRSLVGGVYRGGLSVIENVGYLADVPDWFGQGDKVDEEMTNALSKWAAERKTGYAEYNPIYSEGYDMGFFLQTFQSVAESAVGFGVTGGGVGMGLKLGAKALRAKNVITTLLGEKAFVTMGTAVATNYVESKVMAAEVYKNVKTTALNSGMSEEKAKKMAEKKANQLLWANKVMIASDAITIGKAINLGNFTKGNAERTIKDRIISGSIDSIAESSEEIYGSTISNEIQRTAEIESNIVVEKGDFFDRTTKYMASREGIQEILSGALGGIPQGLAMKSIDVAKKQFYDDEFPDFEGPIVQSPSKEVESPGEAPTDPETLRGNNGVSHLVPAAEKKYKEWEAKKKEYDKYLDEKEKYETYAKDKEDYERKKANFKEVRDIGKIEKAKEDIERVNREDTKLQQEYKDALLEGDNAKAQDVQNQMFEGVFSRYANRGATEVLEHHLKDVIENSTNEDEKANARKFLAKIPEYQQEYGKLINRNGHNEDLNAHLFGIKARTDSAKEVLKDQERKVTETYDGLSRSLEANGEAITSTQQQVLEAKAQLDAIAEVKKKQGSEFIELELREKEKVLNKKLEELKKTQEELGEKQDFKSAASNQSLNDYIKSIKDKEKVASSILSYEKYGSMVNKESFSKEYREGKLNSLIELSNEAKDLTELDFIANELDNHNFTKRERNKLRESLTGKIKVLEKEENKKISEYNAIIESFNETQDELNRQIDVRKKGLEREKKIQEKFNEVANSKDPTINEIKALIKEIDDLDTKETNDLEGKNDTKTKQLIKEKRSRIEELNQELAEIENEGLPESEVNDRIKLLEDSIKREEVVIKRGSEEVKVESAKKIKKLRSELKKANKELANVNKINQQKKDYNKQKLEKEVKKLKSQIAKETSLNKDDLSRLEQAIQRLYELEISKKDEIAKIKKELEAFMLDNEDKDVAKQKELNTLIEELRNSSNALRNIEDIKDFYQASINRIKEEYDKSIEISEKLEPVYEKQIQEIKDNEYYKAELKRKTEEDKVKGYDEFDKESIITKESYNNFLENGFIDDETLLAISNKKEEGGELTVKEQFVLDYKEGKLEVVEEETTLVEGTETPETNTTEGTTTKKAIVIPGLNTPEESFGEKEKTEEEGTKEKVVTTATKTKIDKLKGKVGGVDETFGPKEGEEVEVDEDSNETQVVEEVVIIDPNRENRDYSDQQVEIEHFPNFHFSLSYINRSNDKFVEGKSDSSIEEFFNGDADRFEGVTAELRLADAQPYGLNSDNATIEVVLVKDGKDVKLEDGRGVKGYLKLPSSNFRIDGANKKNQLTLARKAVFDKLKEGKVISSKVSVKGGLLQDAFEGEVTPKEILMNETQEILFSKENGLYNNENEKRTVAFAPSGAGFVYSLMKDRAGKERLVKLNARRLDDKEANLVFRLLTDKDLNLKEDLELEEVSGITPIQALKLLVFEGGLSGKTKYPLFMNTKDKSITFGSKKMSINDIKANPDELIAYLKTMYVKTDVSLLGRSFEEGGFPRDFKWFGETVSRDSDYNEFQINRGALYLNNHVSVETGSIFNHPQIVLESHEKWNGVDVEVNTKNAKENINAKESAKEHTKTNTPPTISDKDQPTETTITGRESLDNTNPNETKSEDTEIKDESTTIEEQIAELENERKDEIFNRRGNTISANEFERRFTNIIKDDPEWLYFIEKSDEVGQGSISQESNPELFNELVSIGVKPYGGLIDRGRVFARQRVRENEIKKEVDSDIKKEGLKIVTNEFRKKDDVEKFKQINDKYNAKIAALKGESAPTEIEKLEDKIDSLVKERDSKINSLQGSIKYDVKKPVGRKFESFNGEGKASDKEGDKPHFIVDKDGNVGIIESESVAKTIASFPEALLGKSFSAIRVDDLPNGVKVMVTKLAKVDSQGRITEKGELFFTNNSGTIQHGGEMSIDNTTAKQALTSKYAIEIEKVEGEISKLKEKQSNDKLNFKVDEVGDQKNESKGSLLDYGFKQQGTEFQLEIDGENKPFLLTWNRNSGEPTLWGKKLDNGDYTTTDTQATKEDTQKLVDKYVPKKLSELLKEWTDARNLPTGEVLDAQEQISQKIKDELNNLNNELTTEEKQAKLIQDFVDFLEERDCR